MSVPLIPGYTESAQSKTLADLWRPPMGDYPPELWPNLELNQVTHSPIDWLVVEEHFFRDDKHGGAGCVLVNPAGTNTAIEDTSWFGRDLGKVGIWGDGTFDDGLVVTERDASATFMVQTRRPAGTKATLVELCYPFLWYWDAMPAADGWRYVNQAGREQDLVRTTLSDDSWKVEVRALEFRQFLFAWKKSAIVQIDYVYKSDDDPFERVDDEYRNEWAHMRFFATHDLGLGGNPAFSGVMGQYIITGLQNPRAPRWVERDQDHEYPTFIYGVDNAGVPKVHTCNPDELGTYFDKDGTRLHYLTPVYFKREVLQPYAAEPGRYELSRSRLSCLGLWGVAISFNSIGLVEVYLGDLGRDLPPDEWGHWRSYNVPPEGKMDEGRFRRDFLNQWSSSKDPAGDLRRAREKASSVSQRLLGQPIWRPLSGEVRDEFASLIGPLNDDPAALGPPLLLLAKVLVDGIDPSVLRLAVKAEKGELSLQLLKKLTESLGDENDVTQVLRQLQGFRSRGGVAHLSGAEKDSVAQALGVSGKSNVVAFELVLTRCTAALNQISALLAARVDGADG